MTHFLHTADWQIGRQYGQFETDDAALLAEARFDVVARIAALATERDVDAVLVAGDVFDTQGVSDRTIRRLFAAMTAYAGPWVMIAGNHDAALADSVWSRAAQLDCIPANVHVPTQIGVVDLPDATPYLRRRHAGVRFPRYRTWARARRPGAWQRGGPLARHHRRHQPHRA